MWEKWVDLSFEARASIAHGGYYSLKVMDGLRIVSFNSDYGSVKCFIFHINVCIEYLGSSLSETLNF